MKYYKTVSLLCFILLYTLLLPALTYGVDPKNGNYVPADLNLKIHPFVEDYRYGSEYFPAKIKSVRENSLKVNIHFKKRVEDRVIPLGNANINDEYIQSGQNIIVRQVNTDKTEKIIISTIDRRYRYLLILGIALALCMTIGGWITIRSLSGVFVGLGYLFWIALPLIQQGHSILLQIGIFFVLVTILVLPGSLGLSRKSVSAVLAAGMSGTIAAGIIYGLTKWLNLIGLRNETFRVLEYATRYFPKTISEISFSHLIVASSLIGALGVILDVCVDVTSSAAEIARARPDLSIKEHLRRALKVSSQLIGTMTNTLLLAYIGTDLFLILTIYLLPTPTWLLLNKDFIAVEVIRALGGALGFLTAAPLSIIFYRYLRPAKEDERPSPPDLAE